MISGPKKIIDTIFEWKTQLLSIEGLEASKEIDLALKPTYNHITLNKNSVMIQLDVEQYTEKKLTVPIKIEGLKKHSYICLPSFVEVSLMVGMSKYDYLNKNDISAIIYVEDINTTDEKYPVTIVKKPANVIIKNLKPNYVDVITKME